MRAWPARSTFPRAPSALARLCEGRVGLVDLTESNPTRCGFADPARLVALADPAAAAYQPSPFGAIEARGAVCRYYARRGVAIDPAEVVLTASTSEAYGWLLSLLCEPGERVLAPRPSYPLLSHLAQLAGVGIGDYALVRADGWRIDRAAVMDGLDGRTRAMLLVHPNNPTGALVHADDAAWLAELCLERDVALIADEVFLDYTADGVAGFASFARFGAPGPTGGSTEAPLCFTLSGLSKVALTPQLKLGWIVARGREQAEALARLELIADSFLSVSTPAQLCAPALLDAVDPLQQALRARLAENLAALDRGIAWLGRDAPLRRLEREAGWYALLDVPRTRSDDGWLERLVVEAGLIVHPGYFFDMSEDGVMVLSLLIEPEPFAAALARLLPLFAEG